MKQSIYIIIPVYNRKSITLTCLENLKANGDLQKYHVIVIDDGSSDRTSEEVGANYPEVIILKGDGNLWWTGAMALGMTYAYERGAKNFIWLNDDSLPAINTLDLIVNFLQEYPNSIVGAACYVETGQLVETGFKGRQRMKALANETIKVDGLSGYCVGIAASIFKEIGAPDAIKFRQYAGDGMYTLKATRAGFKAYILGSAKVILAEEKDPIHNFTNYIQKIKEYKEYTFKSIFWNYKSPYHLPTQFYYHIYKYGYLTGLPLFIIKATSWVIRFYV
ncbi:MULTISPECIES: glycosyltransferase family 2 protein [Pseudanabaena]|uniref:Glycosyl transferase family 2 n=2 Tax=Pseudanabaena TaxID=1152 RepID=L8N7W9_9CYAN|nr:MULTISPECIES: glycosyltransferase family 2 protein [Pseudanabaena]ELS34333.1 glycosyl transferase family 2 [Pseudanabaena biceps PCC 7429]MDG3493475.1 glycosyltransferase family 2 protein [Pseudanabaena catenata USMAC16]